MLRAVAQALWLSVPVVLAGVLHMLVVRRGWLRGLAVPLDRGHTLGGQPVLGPNKTWRGVLVMPAAGAIFGALQGALAGPWTAGLDPVDFARLGGGSSVAGHALVGAVLGAGYILGELPNSFAKRRARVAPGAQGKGALRWLFTMVDQVDSVLVGLALGAVAFRYPVAVVAAGTVVLPLVHLAVTLVLHKAKLKEAL
ncbi:MAG TPA: CDP-archaeol synthase [Myxococcaceae bacterium]|nr:CDP-archaeol synthase [Myxococcaceae bacterium]